jgi:Zn-dependent protease/predicted transcriptional regulator
MNHKLSLSVGKIAGINLRIHWSFSLLILWAFVTSVNMGHSLDQTIFRIIFIFAVFGCIILHELGHALVAKKFKCETEQIILLPIGGLAQIKKLPEKPSEEFLVTIAGPLVNFAIAAFIYLIFDPTKFADLVENIQNTDNFLEGNFLFNLFVVNLVIAVFNLIPAFPMDGGRMLRAFLSTQFSRAKATQISALIGQMIAIIFIIFGYKHNIFLALIGIFIFIISKTEESYETAKSILANYKVRNLIMTKYTALNHNDNLEKVIAEILSSQEKEFIITDGHKIVGVLNQTNIIHALALKKNFLLSEIMDKSFPKFSPNTSLKEAYEEFATNRYTIGPVIENSKLVGILNRENIQEFLIFNEFMGKS